MAALPLSSWLHPNNADRITDRAGIFQESLISSRTRKDPEFYDKIIQDESLRDLAWEINEQSAKQCSE